MDQTEVWSDLGNALLEQKTSNEESVRQDYALPSGPVPAGIIYITDADMLVAAVRWARTHGIPLVPASSASPHYHACLNTPDGACVVDFSRMKQVIKINRRNRVATFESGVTFEELVPLAGTSGLRVMLPLMPRPGKSALAAYLDREPVIYPKYQWDISDPLICLEAVYGTGDVFRTGSAAGPGTIQQQWAAGEFQKNPMGPGQNDWMKLIQGAQGGIALATWCSAKCEVRPRQERLFIAGSDRLEPLIETSYEMLHKKLTDIHFIVDGAALASLTAKNNEDRDRALALAKEWNLVYTVSGIEHFAEERLEYFAARSEEAARSKGATLVEPPLVKAADFLRRLTHPNILTVEDKRRIAARMPHATNWRNLPLGAHGRVYFQSTMDRAPSFVDRFCELEKQSAVDAERSSCYIQPQLGGRCCHLEFIVAANSTDANDVKEIRDFCSQVAEPLISAGAFFSRPHGEWAKPAMRRAPSSFRAYQKVKAIFDPNHILAPGRLMLGGGGHA